MTATATRMRLFIAEHLRTKSGTWTQLPLRWKRLPKTPEDLVGAIYHFEDGAPPAELALFYQGSWIVWRAQTIELPDVLAEQTESFVVQIRDRLFYDAPGDEEFDALEAMIREMLTKKAAAALEAGKLARSLRRVAVLDGQEPVARMTLSASEIMAGAPG